MCGGIWPYQISLIDRYRPLDNIYIVKHTREVQRAHKIKSYFHRATETERSLICKSQNETSSQFFQLYQTHKAHTKNKEQTEKPWYLQLSSPI